VPGPIITAPEEVKAEEVTPEEVKSEQIKPKASVNDAGGKQNPGE
jgi:hypothetical protein